MLCGSPEQISVKFVSKCNNLDERNIFENIVCKMAAILSGPKFLIGASKIHWWAGWLNSQSLFLNPSLLHFLAPNQGFLV